MEGKEQPRTADLPFLTEFCHVTIDRLLVHK